MNTMELIPGSTNIIELSDSSLIGFNQRPQYQTGLLFKTLIIA